MNLILKFDGNIVQLGFGAVGKSFFEKISLEIKYNENKYYVITANKEDFDPYLQLGAIAANFINQVVTKDNYREIFSKYLQCGDLLIDFAETVSTSEFCDWCAENNVMYLNTANADWPEYWLDIFALNKNTVDVKDRHKSSRETNKHPIVLQHGNNPGLVSHFVKLAIEYICNTQKKGDRQLKTLVRQGNWGEAARVLGIKMIHVNDIDLQKISVHHTKDSLINTWCIDSFLFEVLTEAAFTAGTHENICYTDECKSYDAANGFVEFLTLGADKKCLTYYPGGVFKGFLIPHDETITIAKYLEVTNNNDVLYRPSVMFIYLPCPDSVEYLNNAKVNSYPNPDPLKPADCENIGGETIIRGYKYPQQAEIAYKENISGTEYVGVLLLGEHFDPVWVGNRTDPAFLYKNAKNSYWQTPTITPVAMSALSAVCWMIKNADKGGIYFPDDIVDYKHIVKLAEKYISKTIYKTFNRELIKSALKTDPANPQAADFFVHQ